MTTFAGCFEQKTVPKPEVKAFFDTVVSGEKAVAAVLTAHYTTSERKYDADGTVLAGCDLEITIDITDPDDIYVRFDQHYFGDDYVKEGVETEVIVIEKVDGVYYLTSDSNIKSSHDEVTADFVERYYMPFLFTENEAYKQGGLYYGDYFQLQIYAFPAESFYIDTANNYCVLQDKFSIYEDGVVTTHLDRKTVINSLGLLVSNYEHFTYLETGGVLVSELSADYTLK
jgi:hypothetical protein